MATLLVPPLDDEPWPTLGPQVVQWIEDHAVYGPGEVAGNDYKVTPDFRAQLYRAYEVFPAGHRLAGRRRFKKAYLEERKGTAKTERAMVVAFAESHPSAPVRCDGFDANGEPVGVPVQHPYIPLVSYTVEQTDDLGFNVLRYIVENSDLVGDYDISLERILLLDDRGREAGKLVPLAGSPNARDGARTTFQHFDEPHRMSLARLLRAHSTMEENLYKRVGADAWGLYTSTAGEINEESVARNIREYAEQIDQGHVDDPRLFFFSRFAPDDMPMESPEEVRAFLMEASGPNAEWSGDIDALVSRWFEPKTDRSYYRRVWGNQWVAGGERAFDPKAWAACTRADMVVPDKELVVLGFDGSLWDDHTGLIGTVVSSGHQFVVGHWVPDPDEGIDEDDVDAALRAAFERYDVWRLYADPYRWETHLDAWVGRWGDKRIKSWATAHPKERQMHRALREYKAAIESGELTHDGHSAMAQHIANAVKRRTSLVDEEGAPVWLLSKERNDSPNKVDLAMAGALSWEARGDAVAAGAKRRGSFVPHRIR